MMTSAPRSLTVVVILAIGCIVSIFLSNNAPQQGNGDTSPRLRQESSEYPRQLLELSEGGTDTRTTSDDPAQVWWKDIDPDLKFPCGRYKCFFLSLTNPADGYLVWDVRNAGGAGKAMKAYKYATKLETEHNVTNFLASPPFVAEIPGPFVEKIAGSEDLVKRFSNTTSVIVQPSRTVPEDSVLFKCHKYGKSARHPLDVLVAEGKPGYEERLLEGLAQTILLVQSEPALFYDFQFLVDMDGEIYHLDLDRALRRGKGGTLFIQTCLENAMDKIRASM